MKKRSCGKGREKDTFSAKGKAIAVLLGIFLPLLGILSFIPSIPAEDLPPRPFEIWSKGSFVNITSTLVIAPGETLIIEPGVTVFFGDHQGMEVRGSLLAQGTIDEPIQFTKAPMSTYTEPWGTIMFVEDEGSILKNVIINMSRNGFCISSSSPRVENARIFGVTNSAVVVDSRAGSGSFPIFVNSTLSGGLAGQDFDISGNSEVIALNTTFIENRSNTGDPDSILERQWFLDVQVDDEFGGGLEGSLVTVEDNANGSSSLSQLTDSEGFSSFVATEYVKSFGQTTYYTPHSISVSMEGFDDTTLSEVWVDGNAKPEVTLEDTTAPVTTIVITGTQCSTDTLYIDGTTTISFEVSSGGTRPVQTEYLIDSGNFTTYSGPFTVVEDGPHTIVYRSFDPANNYEQNRVRNVYLDTAAPRLSYTIFPDGEGMNPIEVTPGTTLSLEATDQESGFSHITYFIGGTSYQYSAPLALNIEDDYVIDYTAFDRIGNSAQGSIWLRVVATVPPPVNNPPRFTSNPEETARVGEVYSYQAIAIDDDYDTLSYASVELPYGMMIDSNTGMVTWTPTSDQVGDNRVIITVSDGKDTDQQTFFITVETKEVRPPDNLPIIFGTVGIIIVAFASILGSTEWGRYGFFLFFLVPLYSKLRKEEVLNQFLRGQIYGYIMAYPGENYSSIRRAMDVGNGTLTHHLYILEREGFVSSRVDGRYKRYYPSGVGLKQRPRTKASMIQKAILKMMEQNPTITQKEIAMSLETSKQVINYHIKGLEKRGMITVLRNGSELKYQVAGKRRGS
ncbi:MAG: MarR family transcriptional regulator [Methanobacteriota archaeon]|nr:MAG: MarR family transcriptional regulator [Euryarchaeota archaeon]